jgi:hypothetical protein
VTSLRAKKKAVNGRLSAKSIRRAPHRTAKSKAGVETGTCSSFTLVAIADIKPAAVNDVIYGITREDDPKLDDLCVSLAKQGQLEPIVLTLDNVVLSGHRRLAAAKWLEWTELKARYHPIRSTDPTFEQVLVSYNTQRDKSPHVRLREEIVLADPESAYQQLASEQAEASRVRVGTLALGNRTSRSSISPAKKPLLDAIRRALDELEAYLPVSDRRVFYTILNYPPLLHASKPNSRYRNDKKGYKAVCELLTRARLAGIIPFDAIGDETSPVTTWAVYPNVAPFFRRQIEKFGTGYYRDLMQTQPNHIEIVGEKLTIEGIVRPVAWRYRIPYTIGRGYSSLPPRKDMFDRFEASGKEKLVILFLSDHDPEGWDIARTFGKSMRDDFGVEEVHAVKVGLNPEQVQGLGLPPNDDEGERLRAVRDLHEG